MPRFDPFPGIRYNTQRVDLAAVTAPPYDVIDDAQRALLLQNHPHNVVGIDLPRGQGDPYRQAADDFERWIHEGTLIRDHDAFYGYRMDFADGAGSARHTTGVIGALAISAPGEGGILPHEHTTPKAKTDRLSLLEATRANLSPVWGLSPAPGLSKLVEHVDEPIFSWADGDGVRHSFWVIQDPDRRHAISEAVASPPVVIADGHHRFETSLAYRDERRATDGPGPWDLVMTFVVELADEQLCVLPIHRVLSGLPSGFEFRDAFAPFFDFAPAGTIDGSILDRMESSGSLTLVERSGSWFMRPKPGAFTGVRDLDTARLDAALERLPVHDKVFQHGVDNVVRMVARREAQAGILLRAATVGQILDVANGGERMPPKTTFFHPKPRTGAVFRSLTG